jgi:hypothetical protein
VEGGSPATAWATRSVERVLKCATRGQASVGVGGKKKPPEKSTPNNKDTYTITDGKEPCYHRERIATLRYYTC